MKDVKTLIQKNHLGHLRVTTPQGSNPDDLKGDHIAVNILNVTIISVMTEKRLFPLSSKELVLVNLDQVISLSLSLSLSLCFIKCRVRWLYQCGCFSKRLNLSKKLTGKYPLSLLYLEFVFSIGNILPPI